MTAQRKALKMEEERLLACPFCGGYVLNICRTNSNACWVECNLCGAATRSNKFRKRAIEIWNQRMNVNGFAKINFDDDKDFKK